MPGLVNTYGRTEATSHDFARQAEYALAALLELGADECSGTLADLSSMANYQYANQALPPILQAMSAVIRRDHQPARYRYVQLTEDGRSYLRPADDPSGYIDVPPGHPMAYERYEPAHYVTTVIGDLPAMPDVRHVSGRYDPCAACQLIYDQASPQQRTALERTSNGITPNYPRDETELATELMALGSASEDDHPVSNALTDILANQRIASPWRLARMMFRNAAELLDYRAILRGHTNADTRLQYEIDDGLDREPWLCARCNRFTCTYSATYLDTRGRDRTCCDYCLQDMAFCEDHERFYVDYCPDCPDDDDDSSDYGRSASGIHDYSYRPSPVLHGDGPLYFGIELETVVTNGGIDRCARALVNLSESEDDYYLKFDGSVHDGFELVTHPFDLPAWQEYTDERFKEVLAAASKLGARSWQQPCCGLHIHASRAGLRSESRIAREAHLYRIVKLVEDNAVPMAKYAGRLSNQWATYDKHSRGVSKLEAVKAGREVYGQNRYQAVNLLPSKTIEFRLFRPSLRPETVLASIELVHGIISYTARLSANACIAGGLEFSALTNWMAERADTYPNANARVLERVAPNTPNETDGTNN